MKKYIIALTIAFILFVFFSAFNSDAWGQTNNSLSKVFDMHNNTDRFGIAYAIGLSMGVQVRPIPEEYMDQAKTQCIILGARQGSVGILLPGAIAQRGLVCLSSLTELDKDDNEGWKDICHLFGLEYVRKPTESSVECIAVVGKVA